MSFSRLSKMRDFSTLRETMTDLVEETIGMVRGGTIPVDVLDAGEEYIISTPLPGVAPDDVSISVLGDSLHISGEVTPTPVPPGAQWLMRERHTGTFEREIHLPTRVDPEQARAEFHNGLLTIRLPKAEQARPHTIHIGGSGMDTGSGTGGPLSA